MPSIGASTPARFTLRLAVAVVMAACAFGYCVPGASAVLLHLKNGSTISYQPPRRSATIKPLDAILSNLDYNGGPIMASNTNYVIYWQPAGAPAYPEGYEAGVNRYLQDLAHDSGGHENTDSISSQYNDAAGEFASYNSAFAGALVDTDPYPPNPCTEAAPLCLSDEQIRAELVKFVKSQGLPMDLAHEYFLLTPPGVEDCVEQGFCSAGSEAVEIYCAYHSAVAVEGGVLVYSNDPYVSGNLLCDDGNHPNGNVSDGVIEGGLSHEHNESITDPEPSSGWRDFGGLGGEIGDKCRTEAEATEFGKALGTTESGAKFNQVINGHDYWYQQEWSNKGHKCDQRLTFSTSEAPNATFTSTLLGGREVELDATGSTTGLEVRYVWQFNDTEIPHTEETTSLTTKHLFTRAGSYTVALTVLKATGASRGAARSVVVGKEQAIKFKSAPPPSAAVGGATYVVEAEGGASGEPVSFSIGPVARSVCSVSGATVSFTGVGTCVIDANQPGSVEYLPAAEARQEFAVGKGAQAIHFTSLAPSSARMNGPAYTVAASGGGSGNPVTFAIDASAAGVCRLSGVTVSFIGVGTCEIDADQAGSALYNPAPQAHQSFAVAPEALSPFGPNSKFSGVHAAAASSSGAITISLSVANPGKLSWLATFANGKFGVFSARALKCKKGFIRLAGKCRPASVVYAKGSVGAAGPGTVKVTLKPTVSARKALANARKHHRALVVTLKLTFQSSLGGSPSSSTITLAIKPKK